MEATLQKRVHNITYTVRDTSKFPAPIVFSMRVMPMAIMGSVLFVVFNHVAGPDLWSSNLIVMVLTIM